MSDFKPSSYYNRSAALTDSDNTVSLEKRHVIAAQNLRSFFLQFLVSFFLFKSSVHAIKLTFS